MLENQSTSNFFELETSHDVLSEFTEIQELSTRGFNTLFRAKRMGQWWILKGLKPELRNDIVYQELLRKEFAILKRLQNQTSVVRVESLEVVEEYGPCIVMEWIDGITLRDWLEEKHSKHERLAVARQILKAVEAIHEEQIVHRDLKPSNIMITRNGSYVKLIDFGLSDADSYAIFKQPAGTLGYMSAEQRSSGLTDVRNDLYSLSCIMKQMNLGWTYHKAIKKCQCDLSHRFPDVASFRQAVIRRRRRTKFALLILCSLVFFLIVAAIYNKVRVEKGHTYDVVTEFTVGNLQYNSWGGGLVTVKAANQKDSCIEIPAQVRFRGLTYKIDEITFDAFKNNKILTRVVFPDCRFHVMRGIFEGCPKMQTIFFRCKEPPYVGNAIWKTSITQAFTSKQFDVIILKVPKGCLQKYRTSAWGKFKRIEEYDD